MATPPQGDFSQRRRGGEIKEGEVDGWRDAKCRETKEEGRLNWGKVSHTQKKQLRRQTNKLEEREQRAETQSRKRSAGVMESRWNERRSEPCGASAGGLREEITALIGEKKGEEFTPVITHFFFSLCFFYFFYFVFSTFPLSASRCCFFSFLFLVSLKDSREGRSEGFLPLSPCVFECMVI